MTAEPAARRVLRLTPKNGRYLVAMLVGAPADRARELRDKLAETRGILAKYHLDYERTRAFKMPRIPEDVDLIIYVRSQLAHSKGGAVVRLARRYKREHDGVEVPLIRVPHKWTGLTVGLLVRFGIKKCAPLPLNVTSSAYFHDPAPAAQPEPESKEEGRSATEPSPVAVAPPPSPAPPAPSEAEVRSKFLTMDTLALFRELQLRLRHAGLGPVLVSAEAIEISTPTPPAGAKPAPLVRLHSLEGGAGA